MKPGAPRGIPSPFGSYLSPSSTHLIPSGILRPLSYYNTNAVLDSTSRSVHVLLVLALDPLCLFFPFLKKKEKSGPSASPRHQPQPPTQQRVLHLTPIACASSDPVASCVFKWQLPGRSIHLDSLGQALTCPKTLRQRLQHPPSSLHISRFEVAESANKPSSQRPFGPCSVSVYFSSEPQLFTTHLPRHVYNLQAAPLFLCTFVTNFSHRFSSSYNPFLSPTR